MTNKYLYTVVENKQEVDGVSTLTLLLPDGTHPSFVSGQYITIYFPETGVKEGKAYSISSAPHEKRLSITVKDMGLFSGMLCSLESGETVEGSLPYGFFYSEEEHTTIVLLASGIGVTPLFSLLKDVLHKNSARNVHLVYSVKYEKDILFLKQLQELAHKYPSFSFVVHITQEEVKCVWSRKGRMSVKELVGQFGNGIDTEYFMCGSIAFVRDMWRALRDRGVSEENMYTEAFFG